MNVVFKRGKSSERKHVFDNRDQLAVRTLFFKHESNRV